MREGYSRGSGRCCKWQTVADLSRTEGGTKIGRRVGEKRSSGGYVHDNERYSVLQIENSREDYFQSPKPAPYHDFAKVEHL